MSRRSNKELLPPAWNQSWVLGIVLVLATTVAYQQVWRAGFIWDDDSHLTRNLCIIGPLGFKEIWTTSAATYYPLTLTSFWIQHAVWGLNPVPYHVVNVLVHATCAILLWRVLRHLNVVGAWLGAAIWALHPVQVESVAWITELKNTQSCFFYLLSILFFLKWQDVRNRGNQNLVSWQYALALFCALLAILSKSSTVVLPVVLGLCWWWMDGRWRLRNVAALVPFLLISAAASVWTIWEQKFHARALGTYWTQTWAERLIIAGLDVWFYLGKLIWPHPLIFVYPRWKIDASQPLMYLPVLAVFVGIFVLWWKRNGKTRPLFFAAAYFVVSLFPVLGFFNIYYFRYSFVGDHFQYLASIGPLALIAAAISIAIDVVPLDKRLLRPVACGLPLFLLCILSWRQCATYRNVETLWRTTISRNPHLWLAHNNLGSLLLHSGRSDEAISHFQRAIEIDPDAFESHNNIGDALFQKHRMDEAIDHYRIALQIRPNNAETHGNLGTALLFQGRPGDAITEYDKAAELAPRSVPIRNRLAQLLATCPDSSLRNGARALQIAQVAVELSGGADPDSFRALASAYAETGQFSEAVKAAERALEIAPRTTNDAWKSAIRQETESYRAHDRPSP
jgi:tetratricopeptide (TPR) repeat protein